MPLVENPVTQSFGLCEVAGNISLDQFFAFLKQYDFVGNIVVFSGEDAIKVNHEAWLLEALNGFYLTDGQVGPYGIQSASYVVHVIPQHIDSQFSTVVLSTTIDHERIKQICEAHNSLQVSFTIRPPRGKEKVL